MTISSSYAAFHSLSVSRPITCPRLPTSSKWSVDYLNPPPFVTYICVAGGGGYRSLLGFPLHPFSRTRPHEDFLSPYFLNLRLLSFPCCHCQEGNDKRNLLYTPYHTEKRGEYESYFSFSVWLNVPRDPPSQTGAHRSPALTQIAVTGVETRPRDLLHYIYEEGGCCWLHTHTHNQTPKLTYEKLREMEEMGRGRGKLCGWNEKRNPGVGGMKHIWLIWNPRRKI
jgi:hypothetical protein